MILKSPIISMVLYALFVSVVLAFIRRDEKKAQIKYAISLFIIIVFGALIFGWFMFLFI